VCAADVGRFTLIDDAVATAADHKNNFFVDLHSVGRPRAEAVTENLIELNGEVKGESVVKVRRTQRWNQQARSGRVKERNGD